VLAAVARDLRRGFGERYRILRATSGTDALELLRELRTRGDLVALLEGSGWPVVDVQHGELRPLSRLAEHLTRGLSTELLVYQWAALAQRAS
jgi:hypothetical protein